jgi:hypothetical protein
MCVICLSVHCSSSCFSAASPNCSYLAFLLPLPNLLIPFKLASQGKSLKCITACGVCPGAARLPRELPGYPGSCPVTPPAVFNILPADAGRISSVRSWLLPSTSLPIHYSTAELLSSSLNEPESGVSGLSFDFVSRVRGKAIHWTFRFPCVGIRFLSPPPPQSIRTVCWAHPDACPVGTWIQWPWGLHGKILLFLSAINGSLCHWLCHVFLKSHKLLIIYIKKLIQSYQRNMEW